MLSKHARLRILPAPLLEVERQDEGCDDSTQHEEREPGLEKSCPAEGQKVEKKC